MKWIIERDALIAQTMAFVQSVTGKSGHQPPELSTSSPEVTTVNAMVLQQMVGVPAAVPEGRSPQPPVRQASEIRHEMQARIASFRKHQERFEREREEYFAQTLARLRAAIRDDGIKAPTFKAPPTA